MGSFYSSTHSAQTSHVWLISLELIKVIPGSQINFHLQSGIEFPNFHFGPLTRRDGCPIIWMNWINHLDDTDIVIMIKFQLKFSSIWSERDHKYLIILTTKVINCLLMSGMRAKTNNQGIHSNNWCPGESQSPECRPHLTWLITIIICPEGEQIRFESSADCIAGIHPAGFGSDQRKCHSSMKKKCGSYTDTATEKIRRGLWSTLVS